MADLGELIKNQTSFSLQLTKQLIQNKGLASNLVFSPLSIHVVLSLIAAGSKNETLDELLSYLGSGSAEELNWLSSAVVDSVLTDGSGNGGPKTCCANSVWIQDYLPMKPSFKRIVDDVYKASVKQVDFINKAEEITGEVNSWAENETRGLIKKILSPDSIDQFTRLILANALYFKGVWQDPFKAAMTREYDFHLLKGTSVKAHFMTSTRKQYLNEYNGFKVLRLPYEHGQDKRRLSMNIILPDATDGLPALMERVGSESGFLDSHLQFQFLPVGRFRIPKFKISFDFKASDVLKESGLVAPFEGGLTEMVDSTESPFLQVSEIFHKSFIEVDEIGTEAAAVTITGVFCGSCRTKPVEIDFVADHPFLFLIREDVTGVVLFIGLVLDPTSSS